MNNLLEIHNLHKSFGGLKAVSKVSFSLKTKEITGLLGPNGSGKTTIMNLISGNLKPDSGSIRLNRKEISGIEPHIIAKSGISRTFQLVRVIEDMTVRDNVMTGIAFGHKPMWGEEAERECNRLLDIVGLSAEGNHLAGNLTYVNQKRLEMGRALSLHPKVLLLDEWLAGLNASELHEGIRLVRKLTSLGATVLMVEHVMSAIQALCQNCIVMNSGEIIAYGPTQEVLSNQKVIQAYLGESHA